jgi:nitroreductase
MDKGVYKGKRKEMRERRDKLSMDIIDLIKTRRSIRKFKEEDIDDNQIETVLEAGRWAPSGKNNQPWRFAVIRERELKNALSELTQYSYIIRNAPACIAVFLDHSVSYDHVKDIQAIGACIQNMLLTIHSMGLGGVWIGEILKRKEEVRKLLNAPESMELMAVVAFGHPANPSRGGSRKGLEELIFLRK